MKTVLWLYKRIYLFVGNSHLSKDKGTSYLKLFRKKIEKIYIHTQRVAEKIKNKANKILASEILGEDSTLILYTILATSTPEKYPNPIPMRRR